MCKHIYCPETQYPKGTPFTYLIGWSELNKFYYGVRYKKTCLPSDIWNIYFTSSIPVEEFRKLNGEPDIIKVDFIFDTAEEARAYEEFILTKNDHAHNPNWINLHNGGKDFCSTKESIIKQANSRRGKPLSLIARQKIGNALRGRKHTPEHKRKNSESTKGKKRSKEFCKKNGDNKRGIPHSPEHKRKNSEANKGKKRTPEQIQKNLEARRGYRHSNETKEKISNSQKGKIISEETKQKQSDAKKGKPQSEINIQNRVNKIKGKIHINNGIIQLFVTSEEANVLYNFGFLKGKLLLKIKLKPIKKLKIKNNQKGRVIVNNGIIQKQIKIEFLQEFLDNGWVNEKLKGVKKGDKGFPHTDETKKKLSEHFKGSKWMNDGIVSRQIKPENIFEYLNLGWTFGRLNYHK